MCNVRYLWDDSSINSTKRKLFSVFISLKFSRLWFLGKRQRIHTHIHARMQLHLMQAHNLPAVLRTSGILPGQVMKSTQGQVTKILSVASAREGSFVLTDGHSIPGPRASPAHCQELDWRSRGEADWHFFTPMCLISVATSRHVRHELHSLNAAPSNWHVGAVMGVTGEWIG